ncbi:MAG TPA: YbaB/EbfC family nucleoid-associated protein [Pseudonocardiaceae bacterium]|jgi:DNA-binding protein YbaB|nr:YbaB/EbfC family nucleoid-associated protein [Pseudonocardiaceae bacterium]
MFDTDSDQMEQRLSQWTQGFASKAAQFHTMRAQIEQIQATEVSADGAVRVTVDSTGALTDLALNEKIRDLSPPEVAAQVMACLRRAQQQLAPRVHDAMQATIGSEDGLVERVMSGYRERFGEDPLQCRTETDPGVLGLGVIEDDAVIENSNGLRHHPEENPEPPRRHRHAVPPDDEEYFADRGYLR